MECVVPLCRFGGSFNVIPQDDSFCLPWTIVGNLFALRFINEALMLSMIIRKKFSSCWQKIKLVCFMEDQRIVTALSGDVPSPVVPSSDTRGTSFLLAR